MKNYVVYDSDGKIIKYGECGDNDLGLQASSGQSVLEAKFEPNKKVQDGVLVDYTPTDDELNKTALNELRQERSSMLLGTDFTQLNDASLTDQEKNEWAIYRQALRDLPQNNPNIKDISEVVFPDPPS